MPTYDYICKLCGKAFEIQHRMSDPSPTLGPSCQQGHCKLEKQLSAPAAFVKSPNPFVSKSGKPLPDDKHARPGSSNTSQAAEKTHICGGGCAMHRH